MSQSTASRWMRIADVDGDKIANLRKLVPAVLELLVDQDESIQALVNEKVAFGELVTAAELKRLRDEAKDAADKAQQAAACAEAADEQLALLQHQDVEREACIRQEADHLDWQNLANTLSLCVQFYGLLNPVV